ncbi:MAG: hypothetical protein ACC742_12800 [Thermoanaerobaculales bacterium]
MAYLGILPAAAALVFAAAANSPAEPLRRVVVDDGRASLAVPADWNQIPGEVLELFSLRAAESSGGATAETYQYGFRPGDPGLSFALPQVLIQIRESGRLRYGQFLELPPLEVLRREGNRRVEERTGPLLSRLELEGAVFDRNSFSLWITTSFTLGPYGRVGVESVSFLTERGLFTVHCYAHASRMEAMTPVFARIVDSVRFDEDTIYRPRMGDRWPPAPGIVALALAGFAAVVLLVYLMRRRTPRPAGP